MNVFAFQTVTAVILATGSFRHLRPVLCRRTSERILSDSFDNSMNNLSSYCGLADKDLSVIFLLEESWISLAQHA